MSPEMSWVISLALRKPRADCSILVSLQTPSHFSCFILDISGLPILHTCVQATEKFPSNSTACLGSADNSRNLWSQYWILTKDIDYCCLSKVNIYIYIPISDKGNLQHPQQTFQVLYLLKYTYSLHLRNYFIYLLRN